jgi:nicotinamidase-related amidase
MDYQNGIVVDMLGEPDELLSRAEEAIATARRAGAQVGYVRVAFEDADLEAIPPTSRMGQRVKASGRALHNNSPSTAGMSASYRSRATSSSARSASAHSRLPTSTRNFAAAASTR